MRTRPKEALLRRLGAVLCASDAFVHAQFGRHLYLVTNKSIAAVSRVRVTQ